MSKKVAILMGSHSDWKIMEHSAATLDKLGVEWEARALSAHRAPKLLAEYVEQAEDNGFAVVIAGAGLAAALPGTVAALTALPVFGRSPGQRGVRRRGCDAVDRADAGRRAGGHARSGAPRRGQRRAAGCRDSGLERRWRARRAQGASRSPDRRSRAQQRCRRMT